ncbi:putative sporulation lipoprotein YhcN/YlaJ [Gottschalkia purinilytica]|uniref:Putative sporulation lipoprotein YhcN/YlaJ n=1 Tax=Gottschalkia purinilytica TaxID=1503 RepID=A0A0L0WEL4_GOTPU|nr:YhcN/YlaJ family sporulation lipoprotein [Gottschalkia purinilytica]KNF09865.1 putative sporulation lipoprotein YhcN/YlaJ [Gottschalkia purinilytica]
MKTKFKFLSLSLVVVLVLSIGAIGCRRAPKKVTPPRNNTNNYAPNTDMNGDDRNRNDNTNIGTNRDRINDNTNLGTDRNGINDNTNLGTDRDRVNNNSMLERSDRIAKKVAELNEVNSATTAITGNTALVGVNLKNNTEGTITSDIKNKVQATVKEADPAITNVVVTADADLIERIENVGRDVRNGKPISGLTQEIEEIIRRVTPNM